jgi:hypothetical protein
LSVVTADANLISVKNAQQHEQSCLARKADSASAGR